MCNISAKYNKEYNTFYYNLDIRGNYIKLFSKIVQLDQEYKLENLTECVAKISTQKIYQHGIIFHVIKWN